MTHVSPLALELSRRQIARHPAAPVGALCPACAAVGQQHAIPCGPRQCAEATIKRAAG